MLPKARIVSPQINGNTCGLTSQPLIILYRPSVLGFLATIFNILTD